MHNEVLFHSYRFIVSYPLPVSLVWASESTTLCKNLSSVQQLKGGREESREAGILDENTSKENSEILLLNWLCEKELETQSGGDS